MKIVFWIVTGIVALMSIGLGVNFIVNYETVSDMFTHLGTPVALLYPLAIAKILGGVALLARKVSPILTKAAYAGLVLDFIAAIVFHFISGDGLTGQVVDGTEYQGAIPAIVNLVLIGVSYALGNKLDKEKL